MGLPLHLTHDSTGVLRKQAHGDSGPDPGLVLIFSAGHPVHVLLPLTHEPHELGRAQGPLADVMDPRMSRQHARVSHADGQFHITDLGSRNGSKLCGARVRGSVIAQGGVLRLGDSLFLLCSDLRPYREFGVGTQGERVLGPALGETMLSIASAARVSRTLFITGESGSGKEALALAYHHASAEKDGPFVPINCSTIAEGVAERLLFGAVKGAYSGAQAASAGYLETADGGTLFLDEVADLNLGVQAKLLRVLETGSVLPLGATRPRPVQLRVCCATHLDLRQLVALGRFRADLFFRIGVPEVAVPPLRQRLEEIPWHIEGAVQRAGASLSIRASFVMACLLRPWPGNVRELRAEVSTAVIAALAEDAGVLDVRHLRPSAGQPLGVSEPPRDPAAEPEQADPEPATRAAILAALADARGNVSAAARALGIQRTQLRRHLERYGLALKKR